MHAFYRHVELCWVMLHVKILLLVTVFMIWTVIIVNTSMCSPVTARIRNNCCVRLILLFDASRNCSTPEWH